MIGRDLKSLYIPPERAPGGAVLEIAGLRTPAHPDHALDLVAARGEILGMAGLVGAGRTELARAVFGIDRPARRASCASMAAPIAIAHAARRHRPRHLPRAGGPQALRAGARLLGDREHLARQPRRLRRAACSIRTGAERRNADERSAALDIRTASVDTLVGTLSGGNQQKVVLAKWLSMTPQVVIFDEPTRGIDVGSKSEIYRLMRGLADSGVAVLMISSDMEEVIGVSDRIVVMREGRDRRLPGARRVQRGERDAAGRRPARTCRQRRPSSC